MELGHYLAPLVIMGIAWCMAQPAPVYEVFTR